VEGRSARCRACIRGTDYWHVNVTSEPWSDRRWSPSFGVGLGRFRNIPNTSLVGATTTDANLANAAIGLRVYFSRRFVARLDYTIYTAFLATSATANTAR